jgi:hypothetical protein
MKFVCLIFLLVLADQKNLLTDRTFKIVANNINEDDINGIEITFSYASLFFKSCDLNVANYQIGNDLSFKTLNWMYTLVFCAINKDELVR